MCRPVILILTPFQTKKCFFSHSHVIRPGFYNPYPFSHLPLRNYVFRICMFLLLSYSFGIETINKFIHPRSSLENNTRFQAKMGRVRSRLVAKSIPFFAPKRSQNRPFWAAHTYMAYIASAHRGRGKGARDLLQQQATDYFAVLSSPVSKMNP